MFKSNKNWLKKNLPIKKSFLFFAIKNIITRGYFNEAGGNSKPTIILFCPHKTTHWWTGIYSVYMTKVCSRAMILGHVTVVPVCSFEFLFDRSCVEVYHLDGFVFRCCIEMDAITGKFQSSAGFFVVFQVHQFIISPRGGICVSENELLIYKYIS